MKLRWPSKKDNSNKLKEGKVAKRLQHTSEYPYSPVRTRYLATQLYQQLA